MSKTSKDTAVQPSMYDIMRKEKRKLTQEELQEFYRQALEQQSVTETGDPLAEAWIHAKNSRGWK